jgi:hypothetical protein
MSSEIYDLTQPAHDPNIPKPRGLLPVPPFVEEAIAEDRARMPQHFTEEYGQKCRNYMTLHWWYEGHYIAWRETPAGVEVLAVGWDEVWKLLDGYSPDERRGIRTGEP